MTEPTVDDIGPVDPADLRRMLELACTMLLKLALAHAVPDGEMEALNARALEVVLAAETGEPDAKAFVQSAMLRPWTVAKAVGDGRRAKVAALN